MPVGDTMAACAMHADMTSCGNDTANYCTWTTMGGTSTCTGAMANQHCAAISAGMGYAAIAATVM
jgi:hypothetical protein